ncbi:hypothetical protein FSP39_016419 [Pinctada imbricata]|uniref:Reverse transcriptase domain-containing protein n=1 Tax=Pinctada imbricata TaxID=66713 RepID=A0AA89BVW5_PINIB|nr:hypothetical protein FSP39_016419 [Pinctada imbricata]
MKTDITDAFKTIPVHPSLWPFQGIQWENQYYFYTQLVFGSRSSPKIFDYLSQAVCWIATNKFAIENILHLLDDFLVIEDPGRNANETMARFQSVFNTLSIPLSAKKTVGPSTSIEYLGIILDSENMEARLPLDKLNRILSIIRQFSSKRTCTKRELLSLLGHLNFASRVVVPGRSFVSHLIAMSTNVKKLHHHVHLNKECRADLAMWAVFLEGWNGISFFLDDNITRAADIELFTDATPTSFGGIYNNQWFQGYFPISLQEEQMSMAFCELYPIVMACILLGSEWKRKRILFHCDNLATVEIIRKGRSKIPSIMKLMRSLTFQSAKCNFIIHAKHIPGVRNDIADALSRFQMDRFRRLAPQAEKDPTPCVSVKDILMD